MSNYIRPRIAGATLFFTVRLAAKGTSLLTEEVERLRVAVRKTQCERPFRVAAWVVLPDHMHFVWTLPAGDADYPVRWGAIKGRFSRGLEPGHLRQSHTVRREKGIWQRRYWEHHIRDPEEFDEHVRYCWMNPVKHGLATRPDDWPYSSVHRDKHSRQAATGIGQHPRLLPGQTGEGAQDAHPTQVTSG